ERLEVPVADIVLDQRHSYLPLAAGKDIVDLGPVVVGEETLGQPYAVRKCKTSPAICVWEGRVIPVVQMQKLRGAGIAQMITGGQFTTWLHQLMAWLHLRHLLV